MNHNTMVRPFGLGHFILHSLPKSKQINRICNAYCNWFSGENNVWADSNGEFWILSKLIPHCRIVFDVGANCGDWSRKCLENNPDVQIHAFEAASDNFRKLKSAKLGANVIVNNVAVSDECGSIELNIFGDESPFNSISVSGETHVGTPKSQETIRSMTIDQYAYEKSIESLDYVKIDVEGAEMRVLIGMKNLLASSKIDVIQLEHGRFSIYSRTLIMDYFDLLCRHGFEMYKITHQNLIPFPKYVSDLESFNHQNWLCVRRDSRFTALTHSVVR